MEKVTLVCTSLNPDMKLLNRMRKSAESFDDMLIHIESPYNPKPIPNAYNILIDQAQTEWVCCFCDDDFFYPEGLEKMIEEVHKGIDADVAHFKFRISGYCPPEDKRAWVFGPRYTLCEKKPITPKLLGKHNRLPAGSFFRKSAWSKVAGFEGIKCHDHVFWLKLAIAGCKFKYFDHLVYELQRRDNSAWIRQNRKQ